MKRLGGRPMTVFESKTAEFIAALVWERDLARKVLAQVKDANASHYQRIRALERERDEAREEATLLRDAVSRHLREGLSPDELAALTPEEQT